MSEIECPKCGKSDFTNESYMKRHHKIIHGESLVETYECSIDGCDNVTTNPKFCSQECLGKARRQYEYGTCEAPDCENQTYKTKYCSHDCANKNSWKIRDNAAKRPEVRKKIAEAKKGWTFDMSEEAKQKISEAMSGESHPLYGVTGEDHPSYGVASGLKLQKVDETGHRVRSNWEKEIDLMLHEAGINYEYEPETFELPNGSTYTPDFIIDDRIVIEVKGWADERSRRKAELFMQTYLRFTYVVVGNELPSDIFIDWEERSSLLEKLEEIKENVELEALNP